MFASLKNKIREETGNDPTRITSKTSVLKDRPVVGLGQGVGLGLGSDLKDRPSPSHGLLMEEHLDDSINKSVNLLMGAGKLEELNNASNPSTGVQYSQTVSVSEKTKDGRKEIEFFDNVVTNVQTDGDMLAANLNVEEILDTIKNSRIQKLPLDDVLVKFRLNEAARIKQVAAAEMKVRLMEEQLIEARQQISDCNTKCSRVTQTLAGEKNANALLTQELSCVRNELREQTSRAQELGLKLLTELRDKDTVLLRNAQLNQDIEIAKQSLRSQETDSLDLQSRLTVLENTLLTTEQELRSQRAENEVMSKKAKEMDSISFNQNAASIVENELRKNVNTLEEQLAEKVKSIRILQQHLGDLKKTLQKELKQNGDDGANVDGGSVAPYTPAPGEPDVNFKYLKHVIMKFLTSREYEAQHLTRAVSTLLRFSPEEERLLRETLDWKMSWFGTRPQLGFGQTSKTIPPS